MHEDDIRIQSVQYVNVGLKGEIQARDQQIERYENTQNHQRSLS